MTVRELHDANGDLYFSISLATHSRSTVRMIEDLLGQPAKWVPTEPSFPRRRSQFPEPTMQEIGKSPAPAPRRLRGRNTRA